jgi:hypothetical protein
MSRNLFKYLTTAPFPSIVLKEKTAPAAGPKAASIETGTVIVLSISGRMFMQPLPVRTSGSQMHHDHKKVTTKNLTGNFRVTFISTILPPPLYTFTSILPPQHTCPVISITTHARQKSVPILSKVLRKRMMPSL